MLKYGDSRFGRLFKSPLLFEEPISRLLFQKPTQHIKFQGPTQHITFQEPISRLVFQEPTFNIKFQDTTFNIKFQEPTHHIKFQSQFIRAIAMHLSEKKRPPGRKKILQDKKSPSYTQRNLFETLLNQTEIRLYLPFSV